MQNNSKNGHKHNGLGNPKKIKVLMYHLITNDKKLCEKHKNIAVHIDEFRNQMEFLDRYGFVTITFEDYLLFLKGELNLPKKPIILSFDDGFADIHKHAFPILQEFGMRAVLFILGDRKIKTNQWEIPSSIPRLSLLSDYQIIEMHDAGFEIGSHALTHPKLPNIPNGTAYHEISRSRMLLEILINAPVHSFAYPYGLLNDSIKKLVIDAGYSIGCATYSGPALFGKDLFEIRRINISGMLSRLGFSAHVLTPYEYLYWMRWKTGQILVSDKGKIKTTIRNLTNAE